MNNKVQKTGPGFLLISLGTACVFFGAWSGLILLLREGWERLRPAMGTGDTASVMAGTVFLLLGLHLVQGLFYCPRSRRDPVIFYRKNFFSGPLVFLLWPSKGYPVFGPGLEATSTPEESEVIRNKVSQSLGRFTLWSRLALLLEGRNPVDMLLGIWITKAPKILSWPAWFFYWLMEPSRLFLRLGGYIFYKLEQSFSSPSAEDELTVYKGNVALDLAWRAEKLGLDPFGEDGTGLSSILAALRRVYDEPGYGGEVEARENPEETGLYQSPWLQPEYRGAYLDWPVTGSPRWLEDFYDRAGERAANAFYPPELGYEVMEAALVVSERRRLAEHLEQWNAEGLMLLDGCLVLTWEVEAELAELDAALLRFKRRLSAHHRCCYTWHLSVAKRRGEIWEQALRLWLGWLFFWEQARSSLSQAEEDFLKAFGGKEGEGGEGENQTPLGLGSNFYSIWDGIVKMAGIKGPPGEPGHGLKIEPWEAPTASTLHTWSSQRPLRSRELSVELNRLGHEALTALLELYRQLDDWEAIEPKSTPTPPPPLCLTPPQWIKPTVGLAAQDLGSWTLKDLQTEEISLQFFQNPFLKPTTSERLKVGPVRVALTALFFCLFWWQGQHLGLSRIVAHNGLGSEVLLEINGERLEVPAQGMGELRFTPDQIVEVKTTVQGKIVEQFSQQLASVPSQEIYNVAGAAPLMEWHSFGNETHDGRFLGRPRWLVTQAEVLFTDPTPGQDALVLSSYGDLPPDEILAAFEDGRDRQELIDLHVTWDEPDSPWYELWRNLGIESGQ